MRLKRFTAATMPEALKLIKTELGEDAVILATRKVDGANGQPALEITAAVDSPDRPEPTAGTPTAAGSNLTGAAAFNSPTMALDNFSKPSSEQPQDLPALMAQHGVIPDISDKVTKAVDALASSGFNGYDTLEMVLGKMVPFTPPAKALAKGRVHVFVGPTGGGKTTTLCKLAVGRKLEGHSVALFTLDTVKVGAYEQLGIFADVIGETARLLRYPADFPQLLDDAGPRDFVFIDTAGLNPFNPVQLTQLTERIAALGVTPVVHLVLPATLNPVDATAIPMTCAALHPETVIFTKLDETTRFGGVANVAVMSHLKVCFATDGPKVPDDLLELDAATLAGRLMTPPKFPWEME